MNIFSKFSKIIIFGSLLIFLISDQKVFACTPVPGDEWFSTNLLFDKSTLPSGVEVIQTNNSYSPYELINKNSEPLYIVRKNLSSEIFPNSELPQNYEPIYKLASGHVYWWGTRDSRIPKSWLPNGTELNITKNLYVLEGQSQQIYKDDRPANVNVPAPQDFKILAYYRNNPTEIRGIITYSLNADYDSKGFAKGVEVCNSLHMTEIIFDLFLLAIPISLVGLLFFATYKIIRKVIKMIKK